MQDVQDVSIPEQLVHQTSLMEQILQECEELFTQRRGLQVMEVKEEAYDLLQRYTQQVRTVGVILNRSKLVLKKERNGSAHFLILANSSSPLHLHIICICAAQFPT